MAGCYYNIILLFFFWTGGIHSIVATEEPRCFSRFDWEEKLLEKTIKTDVILDDHMQKLNEAMQEIVGQKEQLMELKVKLQADYDDMRKLTADKLKELQERKRRQMAELADFSEEIRMSLKATYIRWGRSVCPGNGSETVYTGYAGGSDHAHTGAAASMVCLPEDPDWLTGKYSDKLDPDVGLMYGAEYQDAQGRQDQLFGVSHHDNDVPCVVCEVKKRSLLLMIPGKSRCPAGWYLEYTGYLMAGHHNHPAATDYYCVDRDPENLLGGGADYNGFLLYFVESRCGSLRCPPYVNGRELQCVVCTK